MPQTKSSFQELIDPTKEDNIDLPTQDKQHFEFLRKNLEKARDMREANYDEFNGMSYSQRYKENMRKAFTFLQPRKDEDDSLVETGTIREKINTIVAAELNLDFGAEARSYDKDDFEDEELGETMTDMIDKSERLEDWDSTKVAVYFEKASQGDVFIEELYVDEKRIDKQKIKFDELTEENKEFNYKKKIKEVFEGCKRNIIAGTQLFVADVYEPTIENQQFIFTRDEISYEQVKALYGEWPRFKYVPKKFKSLSDEDSWLLQGDTKDGMCEVIKYQDKWNDEFQIILNGVPMLPLIKYEGKWEGFPLPWEHGEYNIIKGQFEPISAFFFYGRGIAEKTKFEQEILNAMFKLLVDKTNQSLKPPMANNSGEYLDKRIFRPGFIGNGIKPDDIKPILQQTGVTQSEMSMVEFIKGVIDEKTISPLVQGLSPQGGQTATEINALMQQAKQAMGLILQGDINLHRKLGILRIYNILENWTKPIGSYVDTVTGKMMKKYRTISLNKEIEGKGMGTKIVDLDEGEYGSAELMAQEEGMAYENPKAESIMDLGKPLKKLPPKRPVKITKLNPKALRNWKYSWFVEVTPKQRDTSALEKAQTMSDVQAMAMLWPEILQSEEIKTKVARLNKMNPKNLFGTGQAMAGAMPQIQGGQPVPTPKPTFNQLATPTLM